jgi:hypothetical protein
MEHCNFLIAALASAITFAVAPMLAAKDPKLLATDFGKKLRAALDAGDPAGAWKIYADSKAGGKPFNAKERAFYCLRVLEIRTPRWMTYDAKFFGVKLPTDVPASPQERAYTSPIWYTPS